MKLIYLLLIVFITGCATVKTTYEKSVPGQDGELFVVERIVIESDKDSIVTIDGAIVDNRGKPSTLELIFPALIQNTNVNVGGDGEN